MTGFRFWPHSAVVHFTDNNTMLPVNLFHATQTLGVFKDSKTVVDRPLKVSAAEVHRRWENFEQGWDGSVEALRDFMEEISDAPGTDLLLHKPVDWSEKQDDWLREVVDCEVVSSWMRFLNKQWCVLCRQTNVEQNQSRQHSLLPLSTPHFIPGDRFREIYYWDSHFTVLGLLVCEMLESAVQHIEALMSLLENYGFIPNGGRQYYLNRSQPPVLSLILRVLLDEILSNRIARKHTNRVMDIIKKSVQLLMQEHKYWTTDPHIFRLQGASGETYVLSRYCAQTNSPRPEAYVEDLRTHSGEFFDQKNKQWNDEVFCEIASATESGWDFSSRWLSDLYDARTFRVTRIVPADLNAFLFAMEINISHFASLFDEFKEQEITQHYQRLAAARQSAFDELFWDPETLQWRDFVVEEKPGLSEVKSFVRGGYLSSYVPLYCGVKLPTDSNPVNFVAQLKLSELYKPGGFLASIYTTGQQWDAPNIWPPLQCLVIEGLVALEASSPFSGAKELAEEAAGRFLRSMLVGFERKGCMFEKYDGDELGVPGGGGEYSTQVGFGWTNGVALWLTRQGFTLKMKQKSN